MPDGAAIFETSGAWEDFSTPSRDLRLADCDRFSRFPDRVARRRTASDAEGQERRGRQLRNVLASELALRKISYPRSDGLGVDPCA